MEIWSEIATPKWMANIGIPLIATLLGLAFGYFFLRHQIKSDLRLRHADRREQASLALGLSIAKVLEHFKLPPTDSFWAHDAWPDRDTLIRDRDNALLVLTKTELSEVSKLIHDLDNGWMACLVGAHHLEETPDKAMHKHAMIRALKPYLESFKEQSELLRGWDGRGMVPVKELVPAELHCPADRDHAWHLVRKESYEDVFKGRAGILLVKSLGQPLWGDKTQT